MDLKDISPDEFASFQMEDHERPGKTPDLSDDSLRKIGREKVESLRKLVVEIEHLIQEREVLSKEIFSEGEKIKKEINSFISDIPLDLTTSGEAAKVKGELSQKKVEISEMQLNERVSCWKDVAVLKKELRDNQRELEEKESRIKMLDEILGEDEWDEKV